MTLKKFLNFIFVLFFSVATILSCGVNNALFAAESGSVGIDVGKEKLRVENSKLVDYQGNEFIIHGICIGDSETVYWQKYSEKTYELLKAEGFNTVRYTFSVSLFYDWEEQKVREENIEILDQLMKSASAVGMYVILDLHVLRVNEFSFYSKEEKDDYCLIGDSNPNSTTAAAKAEKYKNAVYRVWEEVVTRVKGNSCVLAYSLINEPYGGIDMSEITYASWDDYLADGHTGSDWDKYVAERDATITKLQQEAIDRVNGDYSALINNLIQKIRAIDGETVICFQPIASLCDVSDNYKFLGLSDCGWTTEDKYPRLSDSNTVNLLLDSGHIYDNALFDYKYNGEKAGVINMSEASGVTTRSSWYADDYKTVTTSDYSYTVTFTEDDMKNSSANDEVQAITLGWCAVYIKNNGASAITVIPKALTIYKKINGEETEIFKVTKDDDKDKLRALGQLGYKGDSGFMATEQRIEAGGESNVGGDGIAALKLGIKVGEEVTVKVDMDISSDSDINASMSFQCGRTYVGKNADGQDLISGEDAVKKVFADAKKFSGSYNSPVYFAEFCVMSNYISEYTNYMDYTNCFIKYLNEYHAGWVWHCMSETTGVTNDNGYGAYINTFTPFEECKVEAVWKVITPLLKTASSYINEEAGGNTQSKGDVADVVENNDAVQTDDGIRFGIVLLACGVEALVSVVLAVALIVRKKRR